jgi:hypothetical protein
MTRKAVCSLVVLEGRAWRSHSPVVSSSLSPRTAPTPAGFVVRADRSWLIDFHGGVGITSMTLSLNPIYAKTLTHPCILVFPYFLINKGQAV